MKNIKTSYDLHGQKYLTVKEHHGNLTTVRNFETNLFIKFLSMSEQIIVLVPKLGTKVDVQRIKDQIRKYVGIRMIAEDSEEMNGLVLNSELSEKDKEEIAEFSTDCECIFIFHENVDDGRFDGKNYAEFTV